MGKAYLQVYQCAILLFSPAREGHFPPDFHIFIRVGFFEEGGRLKFFNSAIHQEPP